MPIYLVIHNDETHSITYVVELFQREVGMPGPTANLLAREIDFAQRASIEMPDVATAERLREAILAHGPDKRSKYSTGPLKVSISENPDDTYSGVFANGTFTLRSDFIDRYRGRSVLRKTGGRLFKRRVSAGQMFLRVRRKVSNAGGLTRIHLLTAIVMMLTMGIILGLNLRTQQLRRLDPVLDNRVYARGFPMRVQIWCANADGSEMIFGNGNPNHADIFEIAFHMSYSNDSEVLGIEKTKFMRWVVNVTAAMFFLFVVAYPIEIMLRNRDRKDALRNPKIE